MNNARGDGNTITFTAGSNRLKGEGYLLGKLVVVNQDTVANGAEAVGWLKGVFEMTKKTADTVTVGASLYWDESNKHLTITPSTFQYAGVAMAAASNSVSLVEVNLNYGGKDVAG